MTFNQSTITDTVEAFSKLNVVDVDECLRINHFSLIFAIRNEQKLDFYLSINNSPLF